MSTRDEPVVGQWARSEGAGLSELLAGYHLRTEAEKGAAVADVSDLPPRYLAEVRDPADAFAADTVLLASIGGAPVGCLVLTAPAAGRAELKRLWSSPAHRGRGIASGLVAAALTHAAAHGAATVRLSVWQWRTPALSLYAHLGFTVTDSWDPRPDLVCMERAVTA